MLGAVLAPTDAAAVAGLAKRMPRRTLTTLRAESLINDGTALVLFAVAVGTRRGPATGPVALAGQFVGSYAGGIAAGLRRRRLVVLVRRRLDDPLREGALSVLTPFLAFLLAELVHASGVVAVVVAGLVLTHASPRVIRARSRVAGLRVLGPGHLPDQRRAVRAGRAAVPPGGGEPRRQDLRRRPLGVAVAITAVVIGTRLVWVHPPAFVIRAVDRRAVQRTRRVGWRQRTASGWAGFRGAVSLATALAVPMTVAGGAPFPDRDLIVFIDVGGHPAHDPRAGHDAARGRPVGPAARGHRARRGAASRPHPRGRGRRSPRCRSSPPSSGSTANSSTGSATEYEDKSATPATTPARTRRARPRTAAAARRPLTTSGRR